MNSKTDDSLQALEQRVIQFIRVRNLVGNGDKLLVAVSGGPDSVCLLLLLTRLQDELDLQLHIAHLNHKLRGLESDDDAKYVTQLAQKLELPVTAGERDVVEYRREHGGTVEEAAREVRYAFLAETARSVGADAVAAGHTTDDNIETILLHLIRGTGTRGLRGLQPKIQWQSSDGSIDIVRPLLEVNRQETLDYCLKRGYKPRLDPTNQSLVPLRNRIRHQLIPLLEGYNSEVGEALLRTARIAGDELDFLDAAADELWGKIAEKQGNTVILDKKGFVRLPKALQRHLLRQAIDRTAGSLKDIETRHIEGILEATNLQAGKRIHLPDGLIFVVEYDRFLLAREPSSLSPFPGLDGQYVLNVPGRTELPGWEISADIIDFGETDTNADSFTALLDFDEVGKDLTVRPRRAADRFYPLGMDKPKKLGEYMIDVKIPKAWRNRIPVVCNHQQIIWIVGYRIDDRVKVTDNTSRILKVNFTAKTGS